MPGVAKKVALFGKLDQIDFIVCRKYCACTSGEASTTFAHANFSVFIDRIRNQFLAK